LYSEAVDPEVLTVFTRCARGVLLLWFWLIVFFAAAPVAQAGSPASGIPEDLPFRPNDPLNAAAFNHFYNMDYDRSVEEFDQVLQKHPDDPFAVNHLLTAVLFQELYRIGALNTGEYANDSFVVTPHHPADPKVKQRIKDLVERARQLEEKRLEANPKDLDALYARGVTRGQFSTYTALIERSWFSALRNAVGARHDHEDVLERSPQYTDAKLIVGAHNYVMGSLPWGVKVAVALVGLGGSRDKGIKYLQEAAGGKGETTVDANILLVLFLRREHRYQEALQTARGLIPKYPQNLLMALEEGNLLRTLGRNPEAAEVYRKIWKAGRSGNYPGLHYELAALSLGDLLRSQKDHSGAAAAYEQVNEVAQPDPELLQKANLGAGEMYDVLQKRDLAVAKYQRVVDGNASTPPAEMARKRMKEPYRDE
jgi:tetratricopeptide (TPR) repeat protein